MRVKEWSFISFSIVALAACGGEGETGSTGTGGETSVSGSTGSGSGTSASGSTGTGGAIDSPGYVVIAQYTPPAGDGQGPWKGAFLASFETVTTPDPGGAVTLSASSDFPVAWTNGKEGTVAVNFYVELNDGSKSGYGTLGCSFPAAPGKGVVPAAALQKMLTAPGSKSSGSINIGTNGSAMVNAGGFSAALSVVAYSLVKTFTVL